ncbi:MAG: hypothetical protein OEZ58_13855 [Gammaproteobacteria bacterium]|nr:hypothetical protein [Gammaproteobacteria bacterium]MDH5730074.1 hypothetical protein [Gammaproteobacteria bacterium]
MIKLKALSLGLVLVLMVGCATYSDSFRQVEQQISQQNFDQALKLLEKNKGNKRDYVLYLMNKGMVARMAGQYGLSNQMLEEAKELAAQLQAVSVSETAGATTVNDGMRSYAGDKHELLFLHLYKALNYLEMGEPDNARIEALQFDVKLDELRSQKAQGSAFANYVSGLVFESLEEWDNALISYRKAMESYDSNLKKVGVAVPDVLKRDLLRLTKRQDFPDEHEKLKSRFNTVQWQNDVDLSEKGEVIILVHNDLAPIKREKASQGHGKDGELVRISLPYYETRPKFLDKASVHVGGGATVDMDLVEDVEQLAINALDSQMGGILARAIARAVIKQKAAKSASKQNGALGLAVNIAGFVSERADTRSWVTLPNNLYMSRLALDPGEYDIDVKLYDHNGNTLLNKTFTAVPVSPGRKLIKSVHWVAKRAKK